ncbi:MAG TPA: hypothetical protein VL096_11230, partial [Pirellulaceae bacterium]|nr:hypothetical protein [Pirellulaceae bacterium]
MGHRQATRAPVIKLARHRSLQIEPLEPRALLAAFTPGNLVLYRVGDGTISTVGSSTAIFLDEYSPAGVLVQSLAMPTAANGANKPLTASNGPTVQEGLMSLSADGRTLIVPGYATTPGTADVNISSSASV